MREGSQTGFRPTFGGRGANESLSKWALSVTSLRAG